MNSLQLQRYKDNSIEPFTMVLLRFHDNDFSSTFNPLMESVLNYITKYIPNNIISEELIHDMIIDGIEYHYKFFQLKNDKNSKRYINSNKTIKYLKMIKILFNKDAQDELQNCNNSENYLLNISTAEIIIL